MRRQLPARTGPSVLTPSRANRGYALGLRRLGCVVIFRRAAQCAVPTPRPSPNPADRGHVLGLSRLSCVVIFWSGFTAEGACRDVVVYSARLQARGSRRHCTVISAASALDTLLTFSGS